MRAGTALARPGRPRDGMRVARLIPYLALMVVLALLLLCYVLAIQNTAAGRGPWPNPTLTPPAVGASR